MFHVVVCPERQPTCLDLIRCSFAETFIYLFCLVGSEVGSLHFADVNFVACFLRRKVCFIANSKDSDQSKCTQNIKPLFALHMP